MNFETIRAYSRKALAYSEANGNEFQRTEMACYIAMLSKCVGELEDLTGGVRRFQDHEHHPPDKLRRGIIDEARNIGALRRKIRANQINNKDGHDSQAI